MTTTKPRTPAEISGAIRVRAEALAKRKAGRYLSDNDCANHDDAHRIMELLSELDSVLLADALTASLEARKS